MQGFFEIHPCVLSYTPKGPFKYYVSTVGGVLGLLIFDVFNEIFVRGLLIFDDIGEGGVNNCKKTAYIILERPHTHSTHIIEML